VDYLNRSTGEVRPFPMISTMDILKSVDTIGMQRESLTTTTAMVERHRKVKKTEMRLEKRR
jgi:hypothetical protein